MARAGGDGLGEVSPIARRSRDPNAQQCGWLKDKFDLSWQVVPKALTEMLKGKDQKVNDAVMKVMLQMKNLGIAALRKAYKEAAAAPAGRR